MVLVQGVENVLEKIDKSNRIIYIHCMWLSEKFESTIWDSKLQKSEKVFLAETQKELHDFKNAIKEWIIKDFGPK